MTDKLPNILMQFLKLKLSETKKIYYKYGDYRSWQNEERPLMILKKCGTLWIDNEIMSSAQSLIGIDNDNIVDIFNRSFISEWDLHVTSVKTI